MTKPNFIVIGAAKSGTTALRHYLVQHPDVWSYMDEIHYFDRCWERGKEWYFKHFTPNGEKIIMEKTPGYYMTDPQKLARVCPDAKLLMIMRNPIDRAYSEYWMWKLHGLPQYNLLTFEKIVENLDHPCLDKGNYAKYLESWFQYFPREQLMFVRAEDLYTDRLNTINKVCSFLGIDEFTPKSLGDIHTGYRPTSKVLTSISGFFAIIRGLNKRRIMWLHWICVKGIRATKALQLKCKKQKYPPLDPKLRERLEAYFKPYNQDLYEMCGIEW